MDSCPGTVTDLVPNSRHCGKTSSSVPHSPSGPALGVAPSDRRQNDSSVVTSFTRAVIRTAVEPPASPTVSGCARKVTDGRCALPSINTGRGCTVKPVASPDNLMVSVGSAIPSSNTSKSKESLPCACPAGMTIRKSPGAAKSPPTVAGTIPSRAAAAPSRAVITVSVSGAPNPLRHAAGR